MVHESISTRFFNHDLHAIDATPARQHGELLRRHHASLRAPAPAPPTSSCSALLGLEEYTSWGNLRWERRWSSKADAGRPDDILTTGERAGSDTTPSR